MYLARVGKLLVLKCIKKLAASKLNQRLGFDWGLTAFGTLIVVCPQNSKLIGHCDVSKRQAFFSKVIVAGHTFRSYLPVSDTTAVGHTFRSYLPVSDTTAAGHTLRCRKRCTVSSRSHNQWVLNLKITASQVSAIRASVPPVSLSADR